MPIYAVHYRYGDDAAAIAAGRPHHRAYLGTLVEAGQLLASGPLVGLGSDQALLIFRADSPAAVEELLAADPFQRDGLVASHTVTEWNALLGAFKDQLA